MSDEDDLLAAELALGLIDGEERRAAAARAAGDPGFAQAVARWEGHGLAMLRATDEAPRPSLWPAIAAALPANDVAPAARDAAGGVGWWRFGTFAASAAALLLAVMAVQRPQPIAPVPVAAPKPHAPLVAMLSGADSKAVVAVSFDPTQDRLTLASLALKPGAHSAELWVIPAGEKPRSLGLVNPDLSVWRRAPGSARGALAAGATLAVSIEPLGGSPTGQPTGPVVLTGRIEAI